MTNLSLTEAGSAVLLGDIDRRECLLCYGIDCLCYVCIRAESVSTRSVWASLIPICLYGYQDAVMPIVIGGDAVSPATEHAVLFCYFIRNSDALVEDLVVLIAVLVMNSFHLDPPKV